MQRMTSTRSAVSGLAATLLLGFGSLALLPGTAGAQTPPHRHHSFIHRHPNATSAAVGYGAYRYAKSRHHGFMHRHPVLTGAAAAALTHHHLKKHNQRTTGR